MSGLRGTISPPTLDHGARQRARQQIFCVQIVETPSANLRNLDRMSLLADTQAGEGETEGEKRRHSEQRDTPFLDRLGFGGGTGRRGSCACERVPLWNLKKKSKNRTEKNRKEIKKQTRQKAKIQTERKAQREKKKRELKPWLAERQWDKWKWEGLQHLQRNS